MPTRRKSSLLTAFVLCGLILLQGCAHHFPQKLHLYGNHPALYTLAFRAAATEALVKDQFGTNYYDHMGDAAYTLPQTQGCDPTLWRNYVELKQQACVLFWGPPSRDCDNAHACVRVQFNRDLVRIGNRRELIERALVNPCAALTPPAIAGRYSTHPTGLGMSASENWTVLQCNGRAVTATVNRFDLDSGVLELVFDEANNR